MLDPHARLDQRTDGRLVVDLRQQVRDGGRCQKDKLAAGVEQAPKRQFDLAVCGFVPARASIEDACSGSGARTGRVGQRRQCRPCQAGRLVVHAPADAGRSGQSLARRSRSVDQIRSSMPLADTDGAGMRRTPSGCTGRQPSCWACRAGARLRQRSPRSDASTCVGDETPGGDLSWSGGPELRQLPILAKQFAELICGA
jgi:hypothetical protein